MCRCFIQQAFLTKELAPTLEAVREGSNTDEPSQHQATHHHVDHGLARFA